METKFLKKIDAFVAVYGLLLCVGAIVWFDMHIFWSVLVGAVLAMGNWVALRWAGIRLAATGNTKKFAIFLMIKTVTIGLIIVLLLSVTSVAPVAFMIGISSLVLGVLTKSSAQALAEGEKALEEDK